MLKSKPEKLATTLSIQAILSSIVIHTLWGGHAVAIKYSLLVFPPMWNAFYRFLIAIICVLAWATLKKINVWPRNEEWRLLVLLGCLFTIQMAALNIGFSATTGSIGAILIGTNPLFAAVMAHFLIPGDVLTRKKLVGLGIAFTGIVVVLLAGSEWENMRKIDVGAFLILVSAILLGMRLIFMAKAQKEIQEIRVVLWQMIISLPIFAFAGILWEDIRWHNIAVEAIAGLLYQGIVIAGLGFMVISYLFNRYPPSVISSFNFIAPISGVALSIMFLGDDLHVGLFIGVLFVGAGLYIVCRQSPVDRLERID